MASNGSAARNAATALCLAAEALGEAQEASKAALAGRMMCPPALDGAYKALERFKATCI